MIMKLLADTSLVAALLPVSNSFAVMTALSIMILWLLPNTGRHHFRKLGTYYHELCHGIASLVTGGSFHRFHIHPNGNGMAVTSGGHQKIIVSAGYIGTILLGVIFLSRSAENKPLVVTLQMLAILIAFSTIKAGDLHTATIGVIVASVLGLCSTLFPNATATRFLMNFMGIILLWQGIHALMILMKLSATYKNTGSDAENLAAETNKHPLHWALVFTGISAVMLLVAFKWIIHS